MRGVGAHQATPASLPHAHTPRPQVTHHPSPTNPLTCTRAPLPACASGLLLEKQTAPIGVLLIIFEARPDALPQIAALALRSGNGLLLKGGKEAARSNAALHRVIVDAIGAPLGPDLIGLVTSRDEISSLLGLHDVIDLVIPRGSNELVSHIQVGAAACGQWGGTKRARSRVPRKQRGRRPPRQRTRQP